MKRILALLCVVLVGCSNDPDGFSQDNHGYGWSYDVLGENGLRLRFTPALQSSSGIYAQASNVAFYETIFRQVQDCAQLTALPPFVVLKDVGQFDTYGMYYWNPSLIVIDPTLINLPHEMVHHLLYYNTGDPDMEHASPMFNEHTGCGGWLVL